MFANVARRNNRKTRLSNWFARERDGDMQAFDMGGVAFGLGVWLDAMQRDRALRRTARADAGAA